MANSTIKITTLDQLKVALQAAKSYVDSQVDGLGDLASKSEVAYADLAAALKALIDGKADGSVVSTLVGSDSGKSVRTISAEEVAKIVAGANENYDTLKEIADWIMSDTTGAAKMSNDINRLDGILSGIGGDSDAYATVVAYVEAMINALGISNYATTSSVTSALSGKVDKVVGSRLITDTEANKLAGIANGAQVNVIEKVKVNNVAVGSDKSVNITVPTGTLASLNTVAESNLDTTLAEKINSAANTGHSHSNKSVLDGITSAKVSAWDAAEQNAKSYVDGMIASTDEVTAMCTEVFGA